MVKDNIKFPIWEKCIIFFGSKESIKKLNKKCLTKVRHFLFNL